MNRTSEKSTTTVAEPGARDCSRALNAGAVARSTSPATFRMTAAVEGAEGGKVCLAAMLIGCGFLAHRGFDGYRVRGNAVTEWPIPNGPSSYQGRYGRGAPEAMELIQLSHT
jgi:hypothetical protein